MLILLGRLATWLVAYRPLIAVGNQLYSLLQSLPWCVWMGRHLQFVHWWSHFSHQNPLFGALPKPVGPVQLVARSHQIRATLRLRFRQRTGCAALQFAQLDRYLV